MPICENKIKTIPVASEIDHHAEAAKVKKRKEQAYFNSYDFDAIEVLPSEDEETQVQKSSGRSGIKLTDDTHQGSATSNCYLKRLTSYFTSSNKSKKNNKKRSNLNSGSEEVHSNSSRSSSVSTEDSSSKLYDSSQQEPANKNSSNSFLLPRAMLKYQSSLANNSMPAAGACASTNNSIGKVHSVITSGDSGTNHQCTGASTSNSGFTQCYVKSDRERITSSSHYSTEKSGSSGYYSSNLCSSSSVEEHIYSEPVIETVDTHISKLAGLSSQTLVKTLVKTEINNENKCSSTITSDKVNENLRILETSIENLDRHLKSYPNSGVREICNLSNCMQTSDRSKHEQLPTIMEGIDGQSLKKVANSWSDELDDSLVDIDLDSFLLDNERDKQGENKAEPLEGVDNPSFHNETILNDKDLENNYKCSKYVNSCPEDAYNVESVIGTEREDKSLTLFLKKYEDHIHFQSTREMLEDIRDKLKALAHSTAGDSRVIPKELEKNIATLKVELEAYLRLMNQNSEIELKQFCAGVVNNQKLVTMTKAFERRKSVCSDHEYERTYEPIQSCDGAIQYPENTKHGSVRCSDPNFKLRRKALSEVFPISSNACYKSNESSTLASNSSLNASHLQRNLSLQKPRLHRANKSEDEKNSILEWHKNKPSIWELYYGTNRINQTLVGKRGQLVKNPASLMSYPSSRPESDFTLDLPRAEQLRLKMEKEKKFRQRCRILTTFLSLVFFLLTVMVVSLVLTRGKRMFGSML